MSSPRRFRIRTGGEPGPARWFWVVVHPTLVGMRAAARSWRWGLTDDDEDLWARTVAVTQPIGWVTDPALTGLRVYPASGYAGVLRFAAGHVTPEVVAHEVGHAAVAVYRMNCSLEVRLGQQAGPREETLVSLFGELFASFHGRC